MKKYLLLMAIALLVAEAGCVAGYARKVVAQVKADQANLQYQQEVYEWNEVYFPTKSWQL